MKKRVKKIGIISACTLLGIIIVSIVGFLIYASFYYKADDEALAILENDYVEIRDDYIVLNADNSDTMLIFYPGAKVEEEAYLPILNQIRKGGITCVLVEMPLRMAILNQNAATDIIKEYESSYEHIYIGGHSMGGAMASSYASKHEEAVDGLILLGSYIYGSYSPSNTLTIYGSLNQSVEDKLWYNENIVEIEGGNHAQFGNYGHQKGDEIATITALEQQTIASNAIIQFINSRA